MFAAAPCFANSPAMVSPDTTPEQGEAAGSYSPEALWQMLLKIANSPGGDVTVRQVEQMFRLKLSPNPPGPAGGQFYVNNIPPNFPFAIGVRVTDDKFSVGFEWRQPFTQRQESFPPVPNGFCIPLGRVEESLARHGWALGDKIRINELPPYDTYRNDSRGFLRVFFLGSPPCLGRVEISFGTRIGR